MRSGNVALQQFLLTEVHHVVARPVESPGVEFQSDNGEDDDGKEEEERDVDQRTDGLGY